MDSSDIAYEVDTYNDEDYEIDCSALQTHINLMGGAEYGT